MKEFNKEEYNKMCADLIGWKLTNEDLVFNSFINGVSSSKTFRGYIRKEQKYTRGVPLVVVRGNKKEIDYYREKEMDFTSDWNWIMEVVEKIEDGLKLHTVTSQGMTGHYININRGVSVANSSLSNPSKFMGTGKTKKEAVIRAIWEFLDWYNQQEK